MAFVRRLALFRPLRAALLIVCAFSVSCSKTRARGEELDVAGVWDVMSDDVMDVEVRDSGSIHHGRLSAMGGRVEFHDAGDLRELEIDCSRPELSCPVELWPAELSLSKRALQIDGDEIVISFEGEGQEACRFERGSAATADLETSSEPVRRGLQGVALTGGQLSVILPASCFGEQLPRSARVVLSTGFTASRR